MTDEFSDSELRQVSARVRRLILRAGHHAGSGHTGGSLSEVEILVALYYRILRTVPARPDWPGRDRFILSKGHGSLGYYAVLAARGFFPESELETFDSLGSRLQGHPDMHKAPGVDMSTGSLGQGLSCGVGMALGAKAKGMDFHVFTLLGDGECQEGQVWEAALYAGAHGVSRLVAIVDDNGVQLSARTDEVSSLEPLEEKWRAFRWRTFSCDGHDLGALTATLREAREASESGPAVVVARTVKGKGVSFMEGKYQWHGRPPDAEELGRALEEVEESGP